jgi:hypothetical protein
MWRVINATDTLGEERGVYVKRTCSLGRGLVVDYGYIGVFGEPRTSVVMRCAWRIWEDWVVGVSL